MGYTNTTNIEYVAVGIAGQAMGVLVDDVDLFVRLGGTIREAASGSGVEWAVLPNGKAYPVTCGDIVERRDEDGTYTDRCGAIASNRGACEGHGADRDAWRAMSEAERCQLERMEAEADMWR